MFYIYNHNLTSKKKYFMGAPIAILTFYRCYSNILPALRPFYRLQGWTGCVCYTNNVVKLELRHEKTCCFCMRENKGADQMRVNRAADQRTCKVKDKQIPTTCFSLRKHAHAIYSNIYKNVHFQMKLFNIFLIYARNIDCGYTLEPPH